MTIDQANQAVQAKINERITAMQEAKANAIMSLVDNEDYINTQASMKAIDNDIKTLDSVITQLNNIKPFQAKSGDKFSVNVFPINNFALGIDRLLGIIAGSRSAFVDQLSLEYEAITGISMVELTLAREALGQPAYFSKGSLVPEERGDVSELNQYLKSIALKLGILDIDTTISKEAINLWFERSKLRAETQQLEFEKNEVLDIESTFTLED